MKAKSQSGPVWWQHARGMIIAGLLGAGLAACGPSESEQAETGSDKVVYHRGNFAEPSTLDPQLSKSTTTESNIGRDLFLGLFTDAADATPIYGAAESHTVSEDGLTWTFTIREGHKWSDGTPVTAEDFVFSYRRNLDPETGTPYASLLYLFKNALPINQGKMPVEELGVRALDERTLEVSLEYPAPFLPQILTHQTLFPVPKHLIEEHGRAWVRAEHFASNGAYTLGEFRSNAFVRLEKNPYFYDAENVSIDTVMYYPTDNSSAAVRRFENGELDSNADFPVQQIDRLLRDFPDEVRIHPYLRSTYSIFNVQTEPFNNKDLRMALTMAIDRETMAEKIMRSGQQPAYEMVPPGIANYPQTAAFSWKGQSIEERIEAARAIMTDAGYGPDNPLEVIYRHREGDDNRRRAVAMADMWKKIWVEAELYNTESKTHYADLQAGNFQVADAGWIADYNDPRTYLFLFDSRTGALNYGQYNNPAFDALLDKADQSVLIDERGRILAEAEQVLLDDAPLIPVLYGTSRNLVARHLVGWVDNIEDEHPTRWLSIDESKRKKR